MAVGKTPLLGRSGWEKYYTNEELAFGRWLSVVDLAGCPVFVALYFFLACIVQPRPVDAVVNIPQPPPVILVLQVLLALIAVVVLFIHTQTLPPKKEDGIYLAMSRIGRWVFLTRHCLSLQAAHMVFSLVASAAGIPWLLRLTYGVSLWIGMLGWFVTIQYFALVHFNKDLQAKCKEVETRDPPYYLRAVLVGLHTPALPLATLDLWLGKSHAVLFKECSLPLTAALTLGYTVFYVGLIAINHWFTGGWPYAVLAELKSLKRWAAFVLGQTVILYMFGAVLLAAMHLPSVW